MKELIINELWKLRAELDNAIIDENYEKILEIKQRYVALVEDDRDCENAFICYNHAFWTDREKRGHKILNKESLFKNIESFEKKYIAGKQVSVKLKTQSTTPFLAGEIWVLRAMFDKFLIQSQRGLNELQTEQNMILGKAVYDRLFALVHMEQTEAYHEQIKSIVKEVREGYESIYGEKQPKIDYNQIALEYVEK